MVHTQPTKNNYGTVSPHGVLIDRANAALKNRKNNKLKEQVMMKCFQHFLKQFEF